MHVQRHAVVSFEANRYTQTGMGFDRNASQDNQVTRLPTRDGGFSEGGRQGASEGRGREKQEREDRRNKEPK